MMELVTVQLARLLNKQTKKSGGALGFPFLLIT